MKKVLIYILIIISGNLYCQTKSVTDGNGHVLSFGGGSMSVTIAATPPAAGATQIIANHTIVDDYDIIPQQYIDSVKKMWLVVPGGSHSEAYRTGLTSLEALSATYAVSVTESGTPEAYTATNLRASRATWGDVNNATGWIYTYGEEDWWTSATAISRTKAAITYANSNNLTISALGFGWCYDGLGGDPSTNADAVYGVHWYGESLGSSSGVRMWGLDADDYALTANAVSMDTYLAATQDYIDYCADSIATKVFFSTAPLDTDYAAWGDENRYQGHLKNEHIRSYVDADTTLILFDYADILAYNNSNVVSEITWSGHTFPIIHADNEGGTATGHIGEVGAIRLAKAMWWMLARMAGWDGTAE